MKKLLVLITGFSLILTIACKKSSTTTIPTAPAESAASSSTQTSTESSTANSTSTTSNTATTQTTQTTSTNTTQTTTNSTQTTQPSVVTTGTVTGSLAATATITLNQSNGTTQTTSTAMDSPNYTFTNVPAGESTLVFNSGGQTTQQTVQVNVGQTTQVNPFGSTQELLNALRVQVFEVANKGSSTTVANISTVSLGQPFYTREINIPLRKFEEGFPGVSNRFEWFGIVYEGIITAPADGKYHFQLKSDDGAILYIDDQIVVNNDKVHSSKTANGWIQLQSGKKYKFVLKYFQGPRYHIELVLNVQSPTNFGMKLFNMADFR